MTAPRSSRRTLRRIFVLIALPILLIGGSILLDQIPMSAARPPKDLRTIEDFEAWKQGEILGEGTYASGGESYTVLLAPAGRFLASGPSAYLFDERGEFTDWTADMGDFRTVQNGFDLTSGHVKNIEAPRR
jgi:hypothetical protein